MGVSVRRKNGRKEKIERMNEKVKYKIKKKIKLKKKIEGIMEAGTGFPSK